MAVIDSHIRSLQAEHLTDVLTSDQHTVKPWLSARLDVSPPVRELKDAGVPAGRRPAGLRRWASGGGGGVPAREARDQPVRVGVCREGDEAFRDETRQGFNVVTWRHAGITYYAVSDVEADQLAEFAKLVAQ